jgi:hypothetical protein
MNKVCEQEQAEESATEGTEQQPDSLISEMYFGSETLTREIL